LGQEKSDTWARTQKIKALVRNEVARAAQTADEMPSIQRESSDGAARRIEN